MKNIVIYFSFAILLLINFNLVIAADNEKPASNKSATTSASDDVKKEFHKTKDETKDAISRDIKNLKEQPKQAVKDLKDGAKKKSDEVKDLTTQELKEIREGLKKPIKPTTSDTKNN
jgi:hypothetical protein